MSFRIWKRDEGAEGPTAPRLTRAEGASGGILPPELLAASARRVTALALVAGGLVALFGVVDREFARLPAGSAPAILWIVGMGGGIAASLVMAWVAARSMLSPERLLDAALVYEVAMALFVSLNVYSLPIQPVGVPRGWSAFPLIVPSTRGKTILATVAASAMDPIGLTMQVAAGVPAPRGAGLWLMFLP